MKKDYVLGIDIGTSATKTILVNKAGEVIAHASCGYPLYSPQQNWFEQDPHDWWTAVRTTIKMIIKEIPKPENIMGIGLSGQMHGLVSLDERREVVRPAIIWSDQRNLKQCHWVYEQCGGIDGLRAYTNNRMLAGFTGGKLLWFKENEPHLYSTTKQFILPKDYIRWCLTEELMTDVSDASGTGLLNVCKREWSEKLVALLNLDKSIFPKIVESQEISGYTQAKLANELGLPEGIPVMGGGGDAVLTTIGSGVIDLSTVGISIGTGGVVATTTTSCEENPDSLLQISCHNIPGKWHKMGVAMGAGGALKWIKDLIGQAESVVTNHTNQEVYEILTREASIIPPGSNGLFFLPHLYGSRCPHDDSGSKAAFIGLSSKHTKREIIRSVLEGVVYNFREIFELVSKDPAEVDHIVLSGGGSRSNLWRQITADVLNQKVITVNTSKYGSAYGAALIAGVGVGIWNDISEPIKNMVVESENIPLQENHIAYNDFYVTYKNIYPSIKGIYNQQYTERS